MRCLLVILLLASNGFAATRYVDVDNTGTGGAEDGTSWTDAWTNFAQVVWNDLAGGGTLFVSGGNYNENVRVQANGTTNSPIIIKASQEVGHNDLVTIKTIGAFGYNWFTYDGAKSDDIDATVTNTFDLKTMIATNCNMQVSNITANTSTGGNGATYRWLKIGPNNAQPDSGNNGDGSYGYFSTIGFYSNKMEYCHMEGIGDTGIKHGDREAGIAIDWDQFIVQWCYFTNIGNDMVEVQPGYTVRNCYFDRQVRNPGAHADGFAGPMGKTKVINNIWVDIWDQILYPKIWETTPDDHGDVQIVGNLVYMDNLADPAKVDGVQTSSSFGWETGRPNIPVSNNWHNVIIANNTFIADGTTDAGQIRNMLDLVSGYGSSNTIHFSNVVIKNNILFKSPTSGSSLKGGAGQGFAYTDETLVYDYNNVFSPVSAGKQITFLGTTYSDAIALNAATAFTANSTNEPLFVDSVNFDFTPDGSDTSVRNQGTSLESLSIDGWGIDLTGNSRTNDAGVDVGALEFVEVDPDLELWLRFEGDFEGLGYVSDSSGNERNALDFTLSTNGYIYITPEPDIVTSVDATEVPGLTSAAGNSGLFRWGTNNWGFYGKSGSFLGVTNNLAGITNLSQATICLWLRSESYTNIVGAGDWSADGNATAIGTARATGVAGNWAFARNNVSGTSNQFHFLIMTNNLISPEHYGIDFHRYDGRGPTGGDTTNWQHYAVVFNSGSVTGYLDGVEIGTASGNASSLVMSKAAGANYPWLGIGVNPHSGTPELEDETGEDYPNNGWYNGYLDDVRIYSRLLSQSEIQSVITTTGGTVGEEPEEPPGPSTVNASTLTPTIIKRE